MSPVEGWAEAAGGVPVGHVVRIDREGKIAIPSGLGPDLRPDQEVELVPCGEGLLVLPLGKLLLADVLRQKLTMNRPTHLDLADLDMDELGW